MCWWSLTLDPQWWISIIVAWHIIPCVEGRADTSENLSVNYKSLFWWTNTVLLLHVQTQFFLQPALLMIQEGPPQDNCFACRIVCSTESFPACLCCLTEPSNLTPKSNQSYLFLKEVLILPKDLPTSKVQGWVLKRIHSFLCAWSQTCN